MNWKAIRFIDLYLGVPLVAILAFLKRLAPRIAVPMSQGRKRILLVKFWGIGNLFMMLPATAALRRAYPGASIELLTLETNRSAAVASGAFDAVTTVDTGSPGRFVRTSATAVRSLRRADFDRVIDFEQFARFSALCSALIGKRQTIGFNTAGQHRHLLYTDPVAYDNSKHVMRSYLSLVGRAGAQEDGEWTAALAGREPADVVRSLGLRSHGLRVLLHVGTSDNFSERRWPTSSYAALADLLIERHDAEIVLTGLDDERGLAADVLGQVRHRGSVRDACGRLNVVEFMDLIRQSALVVSADTSAVHIASALGVPVAGLYGPNTPVLYGPWGEGGMAFYRPPSCSPCITNFNAKTHTCRHHEGKGACMSHISPEEVYRGVMRCLPGQVKSGPARLAGEAEPCGR